jgi:Fe-S cluster assembly protein SufD
MTATEPRNEKQQFLNAYMVIEGQSVAPMISRLRQVGIVAFDQLGFPVPRDENWKFTNLAPVIQQKYVHDFPIDPAVEDAITGPEVGLVAGVSPSPRLKIPEAGLPPGMIVCPLKAAIQNRPELVEPYLGRVADPRRHPFVALNTAFLEDGMFVYVPPGIVFEEPIHLSWFNLVGAKEPPRAWHRRALIVIDKGAQATIRESYEGVPSRPYLVNAVTEVVVGENAQLDHYKEQVEGTEAFHIGTMAVQQGRDSRFSTHYFGLGGALSRHEVRVLFTGSNAESTVNGLYQATGTQHMDNHTVIDHAVPHCRSHELYKGILDGKARGVFRGKIDVRKDAQKTDAKQTNQTLLLSGDAMINTKPQLEIFADDVKCTHGATVGQLDDEQLFYLRSRGIDAAQARALLTFAFANDLISRIRLPGLRRDLEQRLLETHNLPATEDE